MATHGALHTESSEPMSEGPSFEWFTFYTQTEVRTNRIETIRWKLNASCRISARALSCNLETWRQIGAGLVTRGWISTIWCAGRKNTFSQTATHRHRCFFPHCITGRMIRRLQVRGAFIRSVFFRSRQNT